MQVLAVDPGTTQSAYLLWDGKRIGARGIVPNEELVEILEDFAWREQADHLAVEMIASYGMPVGKDVFETCLWIGRFIQAWGAVKYTKVYRQEVKLHLCKTPKAKDPNIRQALLDRVGPQGVKKAPGPTYGMKSHLWAALGVAVTWYDENARREKRKRR